MKRHRELAILLVTGAAIWDLAEIGYALQRFGMATFPLVLPGLVATLVGLGVPLLVIARLIAAKGLVWLTLIELGLVAFGVSLTPSAYSITKLVLTLAVVFVVVAWSRVERADSFAS